MSAHLLPVTQKADSGPNRSDLEHAARVARLKAVDEELRAINRSAPAPAPATRSSSGIQEMILTPEEPAAPTPVKKADVANLHPKAQRVAALISAEAAQLLSLAAKADDHYGGARLLDLNGNEISRALGVRYEAAVAARSELERHDLIRFHDDYSGNRGFRVRV